MGSEGSWEAAVAHVVKGGRATGFRSGEIHVKSIEVKKYDMSK